jgi:hypothetical protein
MADRLKPRLLPLLLIAGVLTLAVTAVRTIGERNGWNPAWFGSEAGSPLNPFGIVWLVPVFGFLFGRRLAQIASPPPFVKRFYVPMFAFLVLIGTAGDVGSQLKGESLRTAFGYIVYGAPLLALLGLFAWPRAFVANLVYALCARAPVIVVQYLDIQNGWQTHYGKVHPELPPMTADERLWGLTLAQLFVWVPFTVLLGGGASALGAMTVRR